MSLRQARWGKGGGFVGEGEEKAERCTREVVPGELYREGVVQGGTEEGRKGWGKRFL